MTTYFADQLGEEVRLGRTALTTIGRHLGTMLEDVVTGEMPAPLKDALQRLRARDGDMRDGSTLDHQ